MKSILYAGAVLMAGACIYGFTEYRTTSTKDAFREMYTEEKKTAPAIPVAGEKSVVVAAPEATTPTAKMAERKKSVRPVEEISPVRPIDDGERVETSSLQIEKSEVTVTPPEKMTIKKKKKKLNSKMFSRAPIREDQEEVILVPEKKADVKEAKVSKEL